MLTSDLRASCPFNCTCFSQADRSGKVLIEKLRNTIKVGCWSADVGNQLGSPLIAKLDLLAQEFELTIDLDTMLAELDKEQSGSIDYKEFKSLLD